MRYILTDDGYIDEISFGNPLECKNKNCIEYTGSIPTGYTSLEEWSENAIIQAYKIESGNLVYYQTKATELHALWNSQQNSNKFLTANDIYPVGQIVIKGDNADYSNWLGFAWERTAVGKVLVGIDSTDTDFNTIGKTGGEKTHKLTPPEMPNHTHALKTGAKTATWAEPNYAISYQYQAASTINSTEGMESSGSSQAHNNLQPYQVVAYWKRIS